MATKAPKKEEKATAKPAVEVEEDKSIRINKWDGSAVKNALDDSVKKAILERANFEEQFGLVDGRLIISGLTVAIALLAIVWDFQYPFPASRAILIFCVLSYFLLMGVHTLYTRYCENGIFIVAAQIDGSNKRIWKASSDMLKYDDKYTLILSVKDSKNVREVSSSKSCANFIDVNGVVLDNLVANELNRLYNSLNNEKKDK